MGAKLKRARLPSSATVGNAAVQTRVTAATPAPADTSSDGA